MNQEWPDYSPSRVHVRLREEARPALAYTDQRGPALEAWQTALRGKLWELLGLNRMPASMPGADERCALAVRSLWRRKHALGVIEKLVFTSEDGADVPCYWCWPKRPLQLPGDVSGGGGGGGGTPVFICLQGHTTGMHLSIAAAEEDETTPIRVEGDRDFGLGCMKRGLAALCVEQRAFGQRRERHVGRDLDNPTCHQAAMNALLLGRTLAGERVYDVDRAIDVLEQLHRERGLALDMARLGVMGNSGGGTVSMYAAAVLERVRCVMASCSVCAFRASIVPIHHCVDNYVPHLLRYAEAGDVLGLIAPKPMAVVAGRTDEIFPLAGVEEAVAAGRRVYEALGAAARLTLVVGDGGHRFYAEAGWTAMARVMSGP
jgi:dienelactone hydrolase